MAASQQLIVDEVLDAYPLGRHRCLLDVGGGEGVFACAAAVRHPRLRLMLFDLPAVAERARARFARSGLAARADSWGGDFLCDPLPRGADVISLVRVAFDYPDPVVLALLRAVEPMAAAGGPHAVGGAYFAWYLLAMGKGRARTAAELAALATAAGFNDVRPRATRAPLLVAVLTARRGRAAGADRTNTASVASTLPAPGVTKN